MGEDIINLSSVSAVGTKPGPPSIHAAFEESVRRYQIVTTAELVYQVSSRRLGVVSVRADYILIPLTSTQARIEIAC